MTRMSLPNKEEISVIYLCSKGIFRDIKFIQMNLDVVILFTDNLIQHRMSQIYMKLLYGTRHVNARIVSGKTSYLLSFSVSLAYVL